MAKTGTWVMRKGRLVPKHLAEPLSGRVGGVISDAMTALIHPCDGKMYDSKSQFRRVTKAKGGVEVGNEKLVDRRSCPELDTATRRRDISIAMDQLGL